MSYAHPIRDMPSGSTWRRRDDGCIAVVRAAAEGFVQFACPKSEHRGELFEGTFRRQFEPCFDRSALRSQFSMLLANLVNTNIYWLADSRRILARTPTASRKFELPADAVLIGYYAQPCSPAAFLDDLDDLIASLSTAASAKAQQ